MSISICPKCGSKMCVGSCGFMCDLEKTNMPNKFNDEILKSFDEKFGKKGPEGNCDSIGRNAGCDDCYDNINIREEHRDFLLTALTKVREDEREKLLDFIDKRYLSYCREHNGMPYCKNCGLDLQELKDKYE